MLPKENNIIQTTIDQIKQDLQVDFVGMALAMTPSLSCMTDIKWRYVSGNLSQRYQKIVLQVGHGFAGIVWQTGRRLIEPNLELKTAEELLNYPIAIAEDLKSVSVIPVMKEEEILAVLLVGYRHVTQISSSQISHLEQLANDLAQLLCDEQEVC